jgi:hypothetical protein
VKQTVTGNLPRATVRLGWYAEGFSSFAKLLFLNDYFYIVISEYFADKINKIGHFLCAKSHALKILPLNRLGSRFWQEAFA